MSNTFQVSLEKEELVFSAAHFITFAGDQCESLHGHNYRVKCEVVGALDENGYVVDFIALLDSLREISRSLDHKTLLPTEHERIKVEVDGDEVIARFDDRRWVFPADNCKLLPISNTTAELIARYIAQQLMAQDNPRLAGIEWLTVAVDENEGQWGIFKTQWGSASSDSNG